MSQIETKDSKLSATENAAAVTRVEIGDKSGIDIPRAAGSLTPRISSEEFDDDSDSIDDLTLENESAGLRVSEVERERSKTTNNLAKVLIWSVCVSLPVTCIFAVCSSEPRFEQVSKIVDKWFTLIGPLAGTAAYAYFKGQSDAKR